MGSDDLPADVLEFIEQQIESVPHLEALLLFWEQPEPLSPEQLAARLYIPHEEAARVASDLAQRGLIRASEDVPGCYRFEPEWDTSGELMQRVASIYRRYLVRIANHIHARGSPSVRAFARAFDLKKGGD